MVVRSRLCLVAGTRNSCFFYDAESKTGSRKPETLRLHPYRPAATS